jgi:hypothetical protein
MSSNKFARSQIGVTTAAAGTTAADAGALPPAKSILPVSGADGTKGVILDIHDAYLGNMVRVANLVSTAVLKVYPPTGGTINGAAANAAASSASGKGMTLVCLAATSTGGTWAAW